MPVVFADFVYTEWDVKIYHFSRKKFKLQFRVTNHKRNSLMAHQDLTGVFLSLL